MLTGRKFLTTSLVLVLCVAAATGCRRRSSRGGTTVNNSSSIFTTDQFPGPSVQDGNVADDGRAFSNSGDDFNGSLRATPNGDRGQWIVTYDMDDDGLIAHHYDGSTWTPPVALRALDTSTKFNTGEVIHAFLNTENHASDFARDRNGDAIIVFRIQDVDTDGAGAEGANTTVQFVYFDTSKRGEAGLNHGFDELSTRIDFQDELNENASTLSFVSDGLCGQAFWSDNFGISDYHWGDDTTSIEIVWRQAENNDAAGDGSVEDTALYSARLPLDQAIDADIAISPTVTTRLGIVGFGASDGGTDSDETQPDDIWTTYNNQLIFRAFANTAGPNAPILNPNGDISGGITSDNDITMQLVTYTLDTGGITGPIHLHAISPVATDGDENNANFAFADNDPVPTFWYGADEGLACSVFFFHQVDEEPTGAPTLLNSAKLTIIELDPVTGGILEDFFLGFDDVDEVDNIDDNDATFQISRNGDYIWAAWFQRVDITVGAGNDGGTRGLFVQQYVTTRPDEDGAFTIPALTDTLSGVFNIGVPSASEPVVQWAQFQDCLGYICGNQSDPDIMSIFFEQSDGTLDEVDQAELVADIIPVGVSPLITVTVFETYFNGTQQGSGAVFNNDRTDFNSSDDGLNGDIFAVYAEDIAEPVSDDDRIFAERTGTGAGVAEMTSGNVFRQARGNQDLLFVCTPPGSSIGVFNIADLEDSDERPHPVEHVHVFFEEDRISETEGTNALRTRQYRAQDDTSSFGDTFVPNAGTNFTEPFAFDLPGIDPDDTPEIVGTGVNVNAVGVWFLFLNRIYYQEFIGNSSNDDDEEVGWLNDNGDSNPTLVDDDNDEELNDFEGFFTRSCTCTTLDGAIVFWTKQYGASPVVSRLQVRARE